MTPQDFAAALVAYCRATGGSVTSYIRSVAHNAAVGGVRDSLHLYGLAADVVYDDRLELEEAALIARSFGLTIRREADHDHVTPLSGRAP